MKRMFSILFLAACTGGGGDEPTDKNDEYDMPYCEDTATVVGLDEVTELGFAAADVVGLADGVHNETMIWSPNGTAALTLTVTLGEARFVLSEAVYPDSGEEQPAIGVVCDNRVELDATLQLVTDDGLLDENLTGVLSSIDGLTASVWHELDPDSLGGSLVMDDFVSTADYEERSMQLQVSFDAFGSSGEVGGTISGTGDCEPGADCTAWAEMVSIGMWGVDF